MMVAPLAIVQARTGSTRLPRKMLLPFRGMPLVWHAWNAAVVAFGPHNVVCALPPDAEDDELTDVLRGFGATVQRPDRPAGDVLGRLWEVAHTHRWRPDSVIVRVTPDDPFKDVAAMRRVVGGERLAVELGAEAFTLAALDDAYRRVPLDDAAREHVTWALFRVPPPPPPPGVWTVDTLADYEALP
jgi:spore coat polysaccharide biosynthesis protein SpsF